MRRWTRATIVCLCGGCGASIAVGEPFVIITLPNVQRKRYRCETCEGPAPPDLPAQIELDKEEFDRRIDRLANRLPLDWRTRQAGDREPGEEG